MVHKNPIQEYDEWEKETVQAMGILEQRLTTLAQALQTGVTKATTLEKKTADLATQLEQLDSAQGTFYVLNDLFRTSAKTATLLGHDIEIVLRSTYLANLFPLNDFVSEQTVSVDAFNKITLKQDGIASFLITSSDPNHPIGQDQIGIQIPLVLNYFKQIIKLKLAITLGISRARRQSSNQNLFELFLSRKPRLNGTQNLSSTTKNILSTQMERVVSSKFPLILPDEFKVPSNSAIGPQFFYISHKHTSAAGEYVSFFGRSTVRRRALLNEITSLPSWANAAVKIDSRLITAAIDKRVRDQGAIVSSGYDFRVAENAVYFDASKKESRTGRFLLLEWGISVTGTINIRVKFQVFGRNRILLVGRPTGDIRLDAETHPVDVTDIPGGGDLVEELINLIARRFLPTVANFDEDFPVDPLAKRTEVSLNSERLLILIQK